MKQEPGFDEITREKTPIPSKKGPKIDLDQNKNLQYFKSHKSKKNSFIGEKKDDWSDEIDEEGMKIEDDEF